MAASGVRITGLREKVRDLERLGVAAADLKEAFGEISTEVAHEAHGIVHVDTGALDRTIRPAKTKNKAVIRAGSAAVDYAAVQNYDPRQGNQFLTKPANDNPEEKARKIQANLDDLIRRYDLD